MRAIPASKAIRSALVAVVLSVSGCGLLTVEMTSTPETVRGGEPVTFDIKLTNRSQCPLDTSVALLIPFISTADLNAEFSQIPPDAPPEVLAFIQELRDFIDELCSGGQPAIPTPPVATQPRARAASLNTNGLSAGCRRGEGEIVCEISGRVREPGNGMTFSLFGGRLDCEVDDQIVRCEFRIPFGEAPAAAGGAAAVVQNLSCLTPAQLGIPADAVVEEFGELGAICFVGTFPTMIQGLGPNEMATGQIALPAHGSGVTRNFIIALSDEAEDVGVCKGGSDAGEACDLDDSGDCSGGPCGEGICDGGDNNGLGCDVATQAMDCPNGGTCVACDDVPPTNLLPIDCTTTYVSPEPAPAMSPWGLAGLAVILFAAGSLWLQRRRRRD